MKHYEVFIARYVYLISLEYSVGLCRKTRNIKTLIQREIKDEDGKQFFNGTFKTKALDE